MSKQEQRDLYLSKALKLHSQGYSPLQISRILPVARTTIYGWIVKFAKEKTIAMPTTHLTTKSKEEKDIKALEQELKQLRAELQYQKMRAEAYDVMINIAEKQFNIPIRKKSGAKR